MDEMLEKALKILDEAEEIVSRTKQILASQDVMQMSASDLAKTRKGVE